MAKLSTKARKALPASDFAGPDRSYPIEDKEHGRKAIQMASHAGPKEAAAIKRKVHAKYPDIEISDYTEK